MPVATGLAQSPEAFATLAAEAVTTAMEKAELTSANAVILFVTEALLPHLPAAIRAAAKTANTTQVFGCSAIGIFTEEDWVLDCPAVAAIVFGGDIHLGLASQNPSNNPLLTLATAPAITKTESPQYGGMSGDATGQGKHVVWTSAHSQLTQQAQTHLTGVTKSTGLAHGLTIISQPRVVNQSDQFDIASTNQTDAYQDLQAVWQQHADTAALPTEQLTIIYADTEADLNSGHFSQAGVISLNAQEGSVTISKAIPTGKVMCWAIQQPEATEIVDVIKNICSALHTSTPTFGLCFSNLNRGPFEDGIDHDLNAIKAILPSTPLIGFYGNGTIAHIDDHNQVLTHALVLNLFEIK